MKKILKNLIPVFICLICFASPLFTASAADYSNYDFTYRNVVDSAELINNDKELSNKLKSIGEKYDMDIVVFTVDSIGSKRPELYAADFYEANNYAKDGIILLISMESRDSAIAETGRAMKILNDSKRDEILSDMNYSLSKGNYENAFNIFADKCDSVLGSYNTSRYLKIALVAVVSGLIIALIVALVLKGQLKSVKFQSNAASYLNRNTVRVTQNHDLFLYKTLNKTRKESSSSSSGGGGSFKSSSGTTFSGSSKKF